MSQKVWCTFLHLSLHCKLILNFFMVLVFKSSVINRGRVVTKLFFVRKRDPSLRVSAQSRHDDLGLPDCLRRTLPYFSSFSLCPLDRLKVTLFKVLKSWRVVGFRICVTRKLSYIKE